MDNWDELRTAWQVARVGTVSGAAEALGVHHATVIRHIDALERALGVKLFQRHSRGYTPTEAGHDLLKVTEGVADQFGQLAGRLRGQGAGVTGDLVVTAITGLAGLLVPVLDSFQRRHPGLVVRFLTDPRVFRLEYGEAHVALRAGGAPADADYVVQPFGGVSAGLYAAPRYVAEHGLPAGPGQLGRHRFVATEGDHARAPFHRWLERHVAPAQVVFRTTEAAAIQQAVRAGVGLGFLADYMAADCPELIPAMAPLPEWQAPLWLVTHVDLHRTTKVQAFLAHLKEAAQDWPGFGPNVQL